MASNFFCLSLTLAPWPWMGEWHSRIWEFVQVSCLPPHKNEFNWNFQPLEVMKRLIMCSQCSVTLSFKKIESIPWFALNYPRSIVPATCKSRWQGHPGLGSKRNTCFVFLRFLNGGNQTTWLCRTKVESHLEISQVRFFSAEPFISFLRAHLTRYWSVLNFKTQ